jgi:hypothetical protein
MTNNDRLRKIYAQIRDLAIAMDPSQADNFTANVRLAAGENLTPQDWVEGAKAFVSVYVKAKLLESDTGWVTTTSRGCYLRQTRTVAFKDGISLASKTAFFDYELAIWDGQEFQSHGKDPHYRMVRAIDSEG